MTHSRLHFSLAALLLTVSVAAQRTWIVDSRGGPGVDFTDLPPAVAAASAGDTVLVRANGGVQYESTRVEKGITIRGVDGASRLRDGMLITNVPGGETIVLDNFVIDEAAGFDPAIEALANEGTVVLERIVDPTFTSHIGSLHVDQCKLFIARGCNQSNRSGPIRFIRSTVFLIDCTYIGTFGPNATIECTDTDIHLSNCYIRGGDGTLLWPGCQWYVDPGAAIVGNYHCTFTIGKDCWLQGGELPICAVRGISLGNNGSNLVDPEAVIVDPTPSRLTVQPITTVHPGQGLLGGTLQVRTVGPERGATTLFASLSPARPPLLLPFGAVWLDPGLIIHIDAGAVLPGSRMRTSTIPLPHGSLPPNLPLLFQAVSLDRFGRVALSGPAITTIQ